MTLENCIILERQIKWRKTYRISKIENVRIAGNSEKTDSAHRAKTSTHFPEKNRTALGSLWTIRFRHLMVFRDKLGMAVLLTSAKKCGEVKWVDWMKSVSCHNKHTLTSIVV